MGGLLAFYLVIYLIGAIVLYPVLGKAGEPGWAAFVPIYNAYLVLKICGRPWWWLILFLVPILGFVLEIIVCLDLAKSFGKSVAFAIGLIFLSLIFVGIIGFGSAQYRGKGSQLSF
jgi:uncharacterized protein DUF5684